MSYCPSANLSRCRRNRRRVHRRKSGPPRFFFEYLVFESRPRVASTGHARISFYRIVGKTQFKILGRAEFQQAVDIFVSVRHFDAILDFENSRLHGLCGRRECWAIRHGDDRVRRISRISLLRSLAPARAAFSILGSQPAAPEQATTQEQPGHNSK